MPEAGDDLVARCHRSIARGSSSFHAASRLFEPRIRDDVWLLYAWCRHCDDEVDGQDHGHRPAATAAGAVAAEPDAATRARRFESLRRRTLAALAGDAVEDPAFLALQRVARAHRIDSRWPADLLEGFAMDVAGHRFATVEDTLAYCWGVAGVVGVMMALVMGARDPAVLRRAQDLGLAFQLTNICRDVVEDARAGRVYLPAELLARHGVAPTPAAVADPANARGVHAAACELLARAESFYESSRVGLRDLPLRSAMAVAAARGIYREIGRRVRRGGERTLASRTRVPRPLLGWLLLRGAVLAAWSRVERGRERPARPMLWTRI
ncbi:MAG: phytoene/squalene synthase family protein [Steroidobacteraceae bacterium]|nr:phytoene/squalene synthase family protein [Steroidobacteraceae bacterium]